jgi:phenylacetate-CoA ligase
MCGRGPDYVTSQSCPLRVSSTGVTNASFAGARNDDIVAAIAASTRKLEGKSVPAPFDFKDKREALGKPFGLEPLQKAILYGYSGPRWLRSASSRMSGGDMSLPESTIRSMTQFLFTPLHERLSRARQLTAQQHLLALFERTVQDVPAYREFLAAQRVDPAAVKTYAEFAQLPLVTKQNYVNLYPLASRCRRGTLSGCEMIAVSSGSTGQPQAWPRALSDELDIATRFEQVFVQGFLTGQRRTLVVICFALGSWVGGMYTAQCCRYLAQKGLPLTLVTPGNNVAEILRAVKDLGSQFDQVVLAGYPPFVKDVVDRGTVQGLDWKRYNAKLIFAGEVFSEEWRSLMCERLGAGDPRFATASLYGTADAGVLGNETPLSIGIRRFFAEHPAGAREVFGESRLPTLVQYDACSRYFEMHDNTLVVSGENGVPLVRYHIADKGGIYGFDELLQRVRQLGGDPLAGLDAENIAPLPFVYLFGRADFTVSYFGANIYPENVAVALEQAAVREWVSGKFVLQVRENARHDPELHVTVELAPAIDATASMADEIGTSIREQLLRLNSEFAHYVPLEHQTVHVSLRPSGDPEYFPTGVKHRYTRK